MSVVDPIGSKHSPPKRRSLNADAKAHVVPCPECGYAMVLRDSSFGPFYGCSRFPRCKATHGAHPDGTPLGVPADIATRKARIEAHAWFDVLWKRPPHGLGLMSRQQAYRWLSSRFGCEAHMGEMTIKDCQAVAFYVRANYPKAVPLAEKAIRSAFVTDLDAPFEGVS